MIVFSFASLTSGFGFGRPTWGTRPPPAESNTKRRSKYNSESRGWLPAVIIAAPTRLGRNTTEWEAVVKQWILSDDVCPWWISSVHWKHRFGGDSVSKSEITSFCGFWSTITVDIDWKYSEFDHRLVWNSPNNVALSLSFLDLILQNRIKHDNATLYLISFDTKANYCFPPRPRSVRSRSRPPKVQQQNSVSWLLLFSHFSRCGEISDSMNPFSLRFKKKLYRFGFETISLTFSMVDMNEVTIYWI
jgi:hypothetical protein